MDDQTCDRHASARAKARVLLPSLNQLYLCGHCVKTLPLGEDFFIEYETVKMGASNGDLSDTSGH